MFTFVKKKFFFNLQENPGKNGIPGRTGKVAPLDLEVRRSLLPAGHPADTGTTQWRGDTVISSPPPVHACKPH